MEALLGGTATERIFVRQWDFLVRQLRMDAGGEILRLGAVFELEEGKLLGMQLACTLQRVGPVRFPGF